MVGVPIKEVRAASQWVLDYPGNMLVVNEKKLWGFMPALVENLMSTVTAFLQDTSRHLCGSPGQVLPRP